MASARTLVANDAVPYIEWAGVHTVADAQVGKQLEEFHKTGQPLLSFPCFDFVAKHTFDRPELVKVLEALLGEPHFGYLKTFSDDLPRDYVFRIHNGFVKERRSLVVQLWSPGTIVEFYGPLLLDESEIDYRVARQWITYAVSKTYVRALGIIKRQIHLDQGGLSISDTRTPFSILQGSTVVAGFTTREEFPKWGNMELGDSDQLRNRVEQVKGNGVVINIDYLT